MAETKGSPGTVESLGLTSRNGRGVKASAILFSIGAVMAYRIGKRLEWDSGHRVLGHTGKCRHIHGHRYAAIIVVQSENLDKIDTVVDFGIVKQLVGNWIDLNWDHNLLLNSDDPLLKWLSIADRQQRMQERGSLVKEGIVSKEVYQGKTPYIFEKRNPTAEVIARELHDKAKELLEEEVFGLKVWKVRVYETPTAYADWFHNNDKNHEPKST